MEGAFTLAMFRERGGDVPAGPAGSTAAFGGNCTPVNRGGRQVLPGVEGVELRVVAEGAFPGGPDCQNGSVAGIYRIITY